MKPDFLNKKTGTLALVLLATLLCLTTFTKASFTNQNTLTVDSITVTRPSDRWRIVQNINSDLVNLKYLKHGKDVVIRIFERPPIKIESHKSSMEYHYWKTRFKDWLTDSYTKNGFRIVEFKKENKKIFALGVDKDQRYLMLEFLFKGPQYTSIIIVTELILENNEYIRFRDDFHKVAKSVYFVK